MLHDGELSESETLEPRTADVYAQAAAFYVACLHAGFSDEAQDFAEWFLENFDIDLEE